MKIAVLGTGMVGRAVAVGLDRLGLDVVAGTRDPAASLARTGAEDFGTWAAMNNEIGVGTYLEAARDAVLVVNALNGAASLAGIRAAEIADGTVLLDIANPLDFSAGFPPTLSVKDTDSLGEQIQRAFPETFVVKTLNTLSAELMAHPDRLPEPTSVFVSGDDAEAKHRVATLLAEMGHRDVIDLGGIETSRGVEMWLPLWLRLMGSLGTAEFNVKVVRKP